MDENAFTADDGVGVAIIPVVPVVAVPVVPVVAVPVVPVVDTVEVPVVAVPVVPVPVVVDAVEGAAGETHEVNITETVTVMF